MVDEDKVKVIIADDSKNFIEGLELLLSTQSRFRVIGRFNSGKDLLDNEELGNADLVLLDIEMPEVDGLETAKNINQNFNHLPIIAITMHSAKVYLDELLCSGFKGFVHKPDVARSLFDVIDNVLDDQYNFPENLRIE